MSLLICSLRLASGLPTPPQWLLAKIQAQHEHDEEVDGAGLGGSRCRRWRHWRLSRKQRSTRPPPQLDVQEVHQLLLGIGSCQHCLPTHFSDEGCNQTDESSAKEADHERHDERGNLWKQKDQHQQNHGPIFQSWDPARQARQPPPAHLRLQGGPSRLHWARTDRRRVTRKPGSNSTPTPFL